MTLAPKPGKYIIGNAVTDGHTHIIYVGDHPLDVETPDKDHSLCRGDFPQASTTSFYNGYWHAHSVTADPNVDETLICGPSNESRHPHTHNMIRKVES